MTPHQFRLGMAGGLDFDGGNQFIGAKADIVGGDMKDPRRDTRIAEIEVFTVTLRHQRLEPQIGGAGSRRQPGETAADGDQAEFRFAHKPLPQHAGGGGRQPSMASL
ncbi:MAG: hypothetical protein VB959_21220 [Rhodospirillales bacterium]